MKNLKKPTYHQKKKIAKASIDPMNVLVKEDNSDSIVVLDRTTGKLLEITGKSYSELN